MAIPNITPPTGAWKTVKDLIADTVGPMGVLAIAAGAFVKASAGAALNAQRMAEALKSSDGAERLKQQFENLLGSASAARRQVEMLAKVASGSAFSFDSLADASKNLQVLTDGALNSEKALKKVQDAAAATGAPVDTMATAVADLYNALKTGDGVEAASGQLRNMGAISDETAKKLQSLSASGVGLATTWQVVEADLNRANGAASALGGTIAGLQQQLANIQQGSDTKIGEMYAEGEKAGVRAAIGFKKFTAAVEEANAGPWAAFAGAINSIKEAVGGMLGAFAETGAVKTIFQALGVAAIAALVGINVTIVALIVQLGKLTAKLLVTRTAVAALSATAKGFATLWSGATVGITAFVTVLSTMIALGTRAAGSIKQLKTQIKEFNAESNKGSNKARGMVFTASSPEERDAAEKYLEEQIANAKGGIDQSKKDLSQAREDKQSLDPYRRKAGGINEVQAEGAIQQGEATLQGLIALQEILNDRARDGGITAFDQKRLEMAQKRADLEKDIAGRARERIQAAATPENAAKMAATQKEKAEKELKYAEEATKNRKEDNKMLDKASKDFQKSKQERDSGSEEYNAAVARNKELEKSKETIGFGAGAREVDITDSRHSGNKEYLENKKIIAKGAARVGEGLDYSVLDEAGKNSVSESGKLQAEMAKREAMKQERADAIEKGDSVRQGKVEAEMANLVNPLTGKSEFEKDDKMQGLQDELAIALADVSAGRGGQDKVDDLRGQIGEYAAESMGSSGQRLESELRGAAEKEDEVAKRAAKEAADIEGQTTSEAAAADKAAEDAGKRKLAIQKQLAALQGVEGGDGRAAEMELGPEIKQLQEKLKAVKEVEAAEKAYDEALKSGDQKKIDAAGANLNTKKVDAAGAGAQAGETSASVKQELQGTEQILQIRQQQAAVEQAAAQARRDEIMQELRLRQQISQLAFSNATGTTGEKGGQSETDLKIADVQRTRSRAEEAQALVAERDALRESGGNTDDLDKRIAELGFDKNTNSQDIQSTIKDSDLTEADLRNQQIGANRDIARNAKIQSLSMQEKYAPTQEARENLKKEREGLEDEATIEAKTEEYSKTMDPELAKELATQETQLDRLKTKDEETGTARVDSLTAVGGGATGFIGASPVDIQKEIKTKTVELADTLKKVNEALREQTTVGKAIQTKMEEG